MPRNNVSRANGNPQQTQNAKHTAVSIHIYPTDEVGPTATCSHVSKCKNLLDGLETLGDWKGITTITLVVFTAPSVLLGTVFPGQKW